MVLVDSTDSDSDGPFLPSATSKKSKKEEPPVKKESSAATTKLKTKTVISDTPLRPVDIGSVFGDKPIHRSKDVPEKRKRTVVEDHSDEDFESTLKQLDEAPVNKKSKVLEEKTNKKDKSSKSPVKTEKRKSPAKPEKTNSPVEQKKTRASSRSPTKKPSYKESSPEEEEKPSSEKKKVTEVKSPRKTKPDVKVKEEKPSKNGHKELDSNSNKTTPKSSSKKFKGEPMTVSETPKKTTNDDSVMESPSFDPLEKRKQQAENYRKFLSSHKEGAKNPGSKPVPQVNNNC